MEDSQNRAEIKLKRAVEEVRKLLVPAVSLASAIATCGGEPNQRAKISASVGKSLACAVITSVLKGRECARVTIASWEEVGGQTN